MCRTRCLHREDDLKILCLVKSDPFTDNSGLKPNIHPLGYSRKSSGVSSGHGRGPLRQVICSDFAKKCYEDGRPSRFCEEPGVVIVTVDAAHGPGTLSVTFWRKIEGVVV